jgi:hypothetical protein
MLDAGILKDYRHSRHLPMPVIIENAGNDFRHYFTEATKSLPF